MNIVVVVLDTLRRDHVGVYGNEWIRTPNLDAFGAESLLMTRAYPESLPTLCYRRALHTGQRTFPFRGHREDRGDFRFVAPGWGPIPDSQDTVAETLAPLGYRCAFLTDTTHQFKPGRNFHRGFHEWRWIRGQESDPYRSAAVADEQIERHLPELFGQKETEEQAHYAREYLRKYLQNNAQRATEADYYSARLFTEASRWVDENADAERFFLLVDSFDPHEPWDPPAGYRRLYDPDDQVREVMHSLYAPWEGRLTPRELQRLQGKYAGEVTMVDRWFGHLMESLRISGRFEDTIVAVISDHGHNIGRGPGDKGLISKQGHPMTHSVADLVMMIRHPDSEGAGQRCDALVYNHDLVATLLSVAGVSDEIDKELDGFDFWPTATQGAPWPRTHVTIGWGPLVTVVTDEWWYNASIWGDEPILNRVPDDPDLEHNVASKHPDVCERLRALAIEDAGGEIPPEFTTFHKLPGCTPFTTPLDTNGT